MYDQFGNYTGWQQPGGAPQGVPYTSGPPGSSGGLGGLGGVAYPPGAPQQPAGPQAAGMTPYGYGQAPGQGGYGYYQQDTPVGAFAAANQQWSAAPAPMQQQRAGAYGYDNRFLGATTPGVSGAPSVLQHAQQNPTNSPYLGGSSGQVTNPAANPYASANPELQGVIDASSQDAIRNFQQATMPQLDRAMQMSGSFGNTGIQAMQQQAMGDLGRQLGNIASGVRYQDYQRRGDLTESGLNRQLQADTTNLGARAGDLSRNLAGSLQQAGMNSGQLLDAAKFDAGNVFGAQTINSNLAAGDLGRNAGLAAQQGAFGAGAMNNADQFNASQGNALSQFGAQLGQQNRQFNAGQGNTLNLANAGAGNALLEGWRNRTQQQGQFDANLDRGIWNDNLGWQRQGTQDSIALLQTLMGMQGQGVNSATAIQNTPLGYLQQFANLGMGLGGLGGTNSQNLQGNPLAGALGGWLMGSQMFGNQRVGG